MSTAWTKLQRAHEGSDSGAAAPRGAILEHYGAAIYRYLLGATRDREATDELYQELAVKVLQGEFRHADPERGWFRDYLKTALYHLVNQSRRRPRALPLTQEVAEPVGHPEAPAEDEAFASIWRDELMHRVWRALQDQETRSGQPVHTVLRFRTDHPDMPSHQVAERLSEALGKPITAEWVRKWLQRGRKAFADILVAEVAASIQDPSADDLEDELRELGLLDYCRASLREFRSARKPR
jgi:DNA-directed RNA polymerase specialized sigma24 family protein